MDVQGFGREASVTPSIFSTLRDGCSDAARDFLFPSEDGAVFTLRHSGRSPCHSLILESVPSPAQLASPSSAFLASSPAPGPDESPRGQTCIFDRGADHLEPTQDKTTLPSFPAFLPAACHASIHLPLPPPPLLQILPSLPVFHLGCFSSSQMVYGCT